MRHSFDSVKAFMLSCRQVDNWHVDMTTTASVFPADNSQADKWDALNRHTHDDPKSIQVIAFTHWTYLNRHLYSPSMLRFHFNSKSYVKLQGGQSHSTVSLLSGIMLTHSFARSARHRHCNRQSAPLWTSFVQFSFSISPGETLNCCSSWLSRVALSLKIKTLWTFTMA